MALTGTATWDQESGAIDGSLDVAGPPGASGHVRVRWDMQQRLAEARLDGSLGGRELRAVMLAP